MANKKKSTAPARPSGGQQGNHNALKHGFYSPRFNNIELSDLDTALGDGLFDEIALLRVIIRRVFEFANDNDLQDLDTWSHALNTLGAASTRLAGLLRTQLMLGGDQGSTLKILGEAFGKAAKKLGYSDPSAD